MKSHKPNIQFSTVGSLSWCRTFAVSAALALVGVMAGSVNTAHAQNVSSPAAKVTSCGPTISTCGCTITKSGLYTVSADLDSTQGLNPDGDCIDIRAAKVVLNIGSHTITGPGGATTDVGIQMFHSAFDDTLIGGILPTPATISGWGTGILTNGNAGIFTNIDTSSNNFAGFELNGASNCRLTDWFANTEGTFGLWIRQGGFNFVTEGHADNNGNTGIFVGCSKGGVSGEDCKGATTSSANDIIDNVASNNSNLGVVLDANAKKTVVNANTVSGNTTDDLADETSGCGSNIWVNNSFSTANDACIH